MVGIHKKNSNKLAKSHASDTKQVSNTDNDTDTSAPKLIKRRANRNSTIRSGRTIGEAREKLETKNERVAARKKDKQKKAFRISFTTFGFIVLGIVVIGTGINYLTHRINMPTPPEVVEEVDSIQPTIEVIDEDSTAADGKITNRMINYIGQFEHDLRDLGYTPNRAVVPSGAIREIHLYLNDYNGYIKATIDRDSAITAEDADRLIRYLNGQGITDFEYIDLRVPNKAYWK